MCLGLHQYHNWLYNLYCALPSRRDLVFGKDTVELEPVESVFPSLQFSNAWVCLGSEGRFALCSCVERCAPWCVLQSCMSQTLLDQDESWLYLDVCSYCSAFSTRLDFWHLRSMDRGVGRAQEEAKNISEASFNKSYGVKVNKNLREVKMLVQFVHGVREPGRCAVLSLPWETKSTCPV